MTAEMAGCVSATTGSSVGLPFFLLAMIICLCFCGSGRQTKKAVRFQSQKIENERLAWITSCYGATNTAPSVTLWPFQLSILAVGWHP